MTYFSRWTFLVGFIIALLILLAPGDAQSAPDAVSNSTNWQPDAPGRLLSFPTSISFNPIIDISSTGEIMVVFASGPSTANSDPYISISTNSGVSWPASPTQIGSRANYQSNPTGLFTDNGTAHVMWVETGSDGIGTGNDFRVLYANDTNWSGTQTVISDRSNDDGAVEDVEMANDGETIYAVWVEQDQIFFALRDVGGSWTTKQPISVAGNQTSRPSIAVDSAGTLHMGFIRQSFSFETLASIFQVEYTQSTNNGVSWSTPVVLNNELELQEHVDIMVDTDDVIRLVFGENTPSETVRALQVADNRERYVACESGCVQATSWGLVEHPSDRTFDVFGADPNNLIPVITSNGETTFIYFHGSETQSSDERIYGVNSCNGWSNAPGLDLVPSTGGRRSIKPSISYYSTSLHLVYESVFDDGGTERREIRYLATPYTCTDQNFMPIVMNQQ